MWDAEQSGTSGQCVAGSTLGGDVKQWSGTSLISYEHFYIAWSFHIFMATGVMYDLALKTEDDNQTQISLMAVVFDRLDASL